MVATSNIHYNLTAWASGQTVAIGNRRSNAGKAYQATTAGTTGATGPTHSSGTVSDGGVSWLWLSAIDFITLNAWAASIPSTLTQAVVGLLWNNGEIVGPTQSLSNFTGGLLTLPSPSYTTSATNTITLKPAPGEGFRDNPNFANNALCYNPANGVALKCNVSGDYTGVIYASASYVTFDGLQVYNTGSSSAINTNGFNITIQNCIQQGNPTNNGAITIANNNNSIIRNNVVINLGNNNTIAPLQSYGNCALINNTVVRPSDFTVGGAGIYINDAGTDVRNNAVFGFSGMSTTANGNPDGHNACQTGGVVSGTSGNLTSVPFTTATFVQPNSASGLDLRLATNSTLINTIYPNYIRNSTMIGASTSTGALPNNWQVIAASGLSYNVVATGTTTAATGVPGGMPYVDVRINGTTTGTYHVVWFDNLATPVIAGKQVTLSAYMAITSGSLANISQFVLSHRWNNSSNYGAVPLTSTLTRYSLTTTAPAGATLDNPTYELDFANNAAIDVTIRFAGPQNEIHSTYSAWGVTDPTNTGYANDILGTARPQGAGWDIGAFEYASTVRKPIVFIVS